MTSVAERLVAELPDESKAKAWSGPRNLPKPDARKRKRRQQRASRRANR